MAEILKTKMSILAMLMDKPKTLTDISRASGLAPSTVSQHLKELEAVGAIVKVDNPYIRKWKYYKRVMGFDLNQAVNSRVSFKERLYRFRNISYG